MQIVEAILRIIRTCVSVLVMFIAASGSFKSVRLFFWISQVLLVLDLLKSLNEFSVLPRMGLSLGRCCANNFK